MDDDNGWLICLNIIGGNPFLASCTGKMLFFSKVPSGWWTTLWGELSVTFFILVDGSSSWMIPGLVNIQKTIEHGDLQWNFHEFPKKHVIFHSYVNVYQRVIARTNHQISSTSTVSWTSIWLFVKIVGYSFWLPIKNLSASNCWCVIYLWSTNLLIEANRGVPIWIK